MRKVLILLAIMVLSGCAHKTLKAPKKAPCDFENQEITSGFEDNTK